MCYPMLVYAAIAVATAVVSAKQQKDSANRQEQAIQDGLARDREATAEQYKQIQKSSMDEQAQLHTNILIDSARIAAMQGESGMQGASHDRVAQEAENNNAQDMATLEQNRQRQMTNARLGGVAQQSRATVQLAGIRRPSSAGVALQIGGALANQYKPGSPGEGPVTKPQGWDNAFDNPDNYG